MAPFPTTVPPKARGRVSPPLSYGKERKWAECELTSGEEIHVDPLGKF